MTVAGIAIIAWARRRHAIARSLSLGAVTVGADRPSLALRLAFLVLLLVPLIIPSDWTQDVPARYAKRHPGMLHSAVYPRI